MADIKKDLNSKLKDIKNSISNEDEATKVMSIVLEIVEEFDDRINSIEQRQVALEEKTAEIYGMLEDMEEELVSAMNEEFEAECPYCGETIPFKIPEDGEDFECPNCHNTIELEMVFGDDCGCGCDDCHHDSCGHHHDDEDEEE